MSSVSSTKQSAVTANTTKQTSVTPSPRKPILAWHGREHKRVAEAVPAQVLEVVRPQRNATHGDVTAPALWSGSDAAPQNRLIWTNDNLVALTSLIAGDGQHAPLAGQVDLVYIDPPFAVQNNFSINVEIENGLADEKLPSLIEELAYRDTWENGLDSYLSMMCERLKLFKALLKPTGSIYVHCDWHAGHYLKVLLDEIFGYENFRNEIVWKRTSARSDSHTYNHIHDVIYFYTLGDTLTYNVQYNEYGQEYVGDFYRHVEEGTGRKFRLDNMTSPHPRPNMTYEWRGFSPPTNGWRYSKETMQKLHEENRIWYPDSKAKRPALKRYLDEMPGLPLQSIWTDISPVSPQAADRANFPTQKPLSLLQRIIAASTNPGDLVLDGFCGSGTTMLAAETMTTAEGKPAPRRWIGIDCGKFAVHISRKRLIEASAQPFTVENIGYYTRGDAWQAVLAKRPSAKLYRNALIEIYGGAAVEGFTYLHGRKNGHWVHVGPLDAPLSETLLPAILAEAATTDLRDVDILSADIAVDYNPNAAEYQFGVAAHPKVIPQAAVEAVRERIKRKRRKDDTLEAPPDIHFFSPPDVEVGVVQHPTGVTIKLLRLTVDLDDCLNTQDVRKREEIRRSLTDWRALVDYWAVDWDWHEGQPFENRWQAFRTRKQRQIEMQVAHSYPDHGDKRIAVKVTDIFGNDGLKVVRVTV